MAPQQLGHCWPTVTTGSSDDAVAQVNHTGRLQHPGQLAGKTPHLQAVQAEGLDAAPGAVVPVVVTALGPNSLFARPAPRPALIAAA